MPERNRFPIGHQFGRFCCIHLSLDRETSCGKGGAEGDLPALLFDLGKLFGSPIAGDLAILHPEQIVVSCVDPADDFLEDVEADFVAVVVDARPVADENGRLALVDDLG